MKKTDRTEIKRIVNDEISNFISNELDKEVSKAMKSATSKTREELLKTISDVLDSMYKVLWQKRQFWKADIK